MAAPTTSSVMRRLGVRPVINACGIYTDLGGSILEPEVWAAATEANQTWTSITDLLDRSGEYVAELCGASAARVVPGASAAIALATAACIARGRGEVSQQLPETDTATPRDVVLQHVHQYKYARCATLGGGHLMEAGDAHGTSLAQLEAALDARPVAVLHPAHLDGQPGALTLQTVADVAHRHDIPVIVDAAYLSYPVELIGSFVEAGADLVCLSAKYFYGPNAGGVLLGTAPLIEAVRDLDFTRYESGRWLHFGRALKMDRATIVATVVALERWLTRDHVQRWQQYLHRAELLRDDLVDVTGLHTRLAQFTLDERLIDAPVNCLVLRPRDPGVDSAELERQLAAGTPAIVCVRMGAELIFYLETIEPRQDQALLARLRELPWGADK